MSANQIPAGDEPTGFRQASSAPAPAREPVRVAVIFDEVSCEERLPPPAAEINVYPGVASTKRDAKGEIGLDWHS